MANALEIPAVVGLGHFLTDVSGGDTVIVDGADGVLILDPDPRDRGPIPQGPRRPAAASPGYWVVERNLPSVTTRRRRRSPCSATSSSRTRRRPAPPAGPTASACTAPSSCTSAATPTRPRRSTRAYLRVIREMGEGRPVVIRTLDLGADKFVAAHGPKEPEKNPFLGVRTVRLCLRDTPCSASRCGPSCGPARSATCGSCSR